MLDLAKTLRVLLLAVSVSVLLSTARCSAEYPALEKTLAQSIEKIAAGIKREKTLVCVYDVTGSVPLWRVRGAIQTEVAAGLRAKQVDAVELEYEPAFDWLTTSAQPGSGKDIARWKKAPEKFDALVIGQLKSKSRQFDLQIAVHRRLVAKPVILPAVVLKEQTLSLEANIPKLNLQVVEFVRQRVGEMIGNGECSTAADEALKAGHAKQFGIYHWGRQLGEHEAWLPGDIIQLEAAKFTDNSGQAYMGFSHHTAIVEETVGPQVVRVLHQNFGKAGKTISRATMNFDDFRSGSVVFYRPTGGTSSLPISLLPRRRTSAEIVNDAAKRIDLLKTINPQLDTVHGIWHTWNGWLQTHGEGFNRLQIPVDIPPAYSIKAIAKRTAGQQGLGFGLVVGGRQTMLVLDSHPGDVTGLHLLDGKQVHEQPSVPHKKALPIGQAVNLEVRVAPQTVELLIDGEGRFQWAGDVRRLSLQPQWEMPRKDWLFLTSHFSDFEITSLTLSIP